METLFAREQQGAERVPLPPALARLYGELRLPLWRTKPFVYANLVETIDGVTSLSLPGRSGGGEISGFSRHDRAVMGMLRAVADAVVVGAGTMRSVPRHVWTAEHIYRPLADAYATLRSELGKSVPPVTVIVTRSGAIDLGVRAFTGGESSVRVVTTPAGAERLQREALPPGVRVSAVAPGPGGGLRASAIVQVVSDVLSGPGKLILLEGGPMLMGEFFGDRALDELFLTVAPQVAGRISLANALERPGLVAGRALAPDAAAWGRLLEVRRAESHLFLRYGFERT